jgi:hypothetical protein
VQGCGARAVAGRWKEGPCVGVQRAQVLAAPASYTYFLPLPRIPAITTPPLHLSPPSPPQPPQGSTFLGHGGSHGLSRLRRATHSNPGAGTHVEERSPHLLQKLESLASAAVRAASMIGADLIVVYTSTGGLGAVTCVCAGASGLGEEGWLC